MSHLMAALKGKTLDVEYKVRLLLLYAIFIYQKTVGGSEIQANVVCAWSGLLPNEGPKGDDHLILQEKLERLLVH